MELVRFVKKLAIPQGFEPPRTLAYDDVVAYALTREHLDDDVAGINASLALIPQTRGGDWPEGPTTAAENFVDLVWHECEFRDGKSFAYAVYDAAHRYLGCCYLYPMGVRTPLTEELLAFDVDVSWWVTPEAFEAGYYEKLHAALGEWVATGFPFERPYWSNLRVP